MCHKFTFNAAFAHVPICGMRLSQTVHESAANCRCGAEMDNMIEVADKSSFGC